MSHCVRNFQYIDSVEDGTVAASGWRPLKTPSFDPMSIAYGVVHDAVEHFEEGEDGIENEMMAFGSIYHIRVRGGWWDQFGTNVNAIKMMAWDIARFLNERQFAVSLCPVPMTREFKKVSDSMWDYFCTELTKQYGIDGNAVEVKQGYINACAWMSKGYTRSLKRWKGHEPLTLTAFFNELTLRVQDYIAGKHKDMMKISFNTVTLEHSVEML